MVGGYSFTTAARLFLVRREYLAGRIESSPPSSLSPRPRLRLGGRSTSGSVTADFLVVLALL